MSRISIILLFIIHSSVLLGQQYLIKGVITNSLREPIPNVQISVKNLPHLITMSDDTGFFAISLTPNSYELIFSAEGYSTYKIPATIIDKDIVLSIILLESADEIESATIRGDREWAKYIIKKAIANKHNNNIHKNYTCKAYTKAINYDAKKGKNKSSFSDTDKIANMAEIVANISISEGKIKEEKTAVKNIGDINQLYYLTHTEGISNWYKNLVYIKQLSVTPFISPLSASAILSYKFKMQRTSIGNSGNKIYEINVTPISLSNATIKGTISIEDSTWRIIALNFYLPKYHLTEYDFFQIQQEYFANDTMYYLQKQIFDYSTKSGNKSINGNTQVVYTDYNQRVQFNKKYFNSELGSTSQLAYERDSNYWGSNRNLPLSKSEAIFIQHEDSLNALKLQKWWQDSVDNEYNKITVLKLLFTGQGNYNRAKERHLEFMPLAFTYIPFFIAGPRLFYTIEYSKEYKNKKYNSIKVSPNYGFLNKDIMGEVTFSRLYNPFKRASFGIAAGSKFNTLNNMNWWITAINRSNFYLQKHIDVWHSFEVLNGLYWRNQLSYSIRDNISGYKFHFASDTNQHSLYSTPIAFNAYNALYYSTSVSYTPRQKYLRESYQKLILGSKYPTFSINYKKGLNTLGSSIDFDYLSFEINQVLRMGLVGESKYRVVCGDYLNKKTLKAIDYHYQLSAGPFIMLHPLYTFQGIDSSYSMTNLFIEAHYFHRFNGAIFNKIPILKKLNLIECIGGGALYSKDRDLKYAETFIGVEKIIKLWRKRFKLGIFYATGVSNRFSIAPQFRFSIDFYDTFANKWSY